MPSIRPGSPSAMFIMCSNSLDDRFFVLCARGSLCCSWVARRSAAAVRRDIWFSVSAGESCNCVTPDEVEVAGSDEPMVDDRLDNVVNEVTMFVVPVIDDGLNVCGVLNGLRECVAGSGLKAILDGSLCYKIKNQIEIVRQLPKEYELN